MIWYQIPLKYHPQSMRCYHLRQHCVDGLCRLSIAWGNIISCLFVDFIGSKPQNQSGDWSPGDAEFTNKHIKVNLQIYVPQTRKIYNCLVLKLSFTIPRCMEGARKLHYGSSRVDFQYYLSQVSPPPYSNRVPLPCAGLHKK